MRKVQREERRGDTSREIYFNELAVGLQRLGKSKFSLVDWEGGDPGKSSSLSPKAVCWQKFSLLRGVLGSPMMFK